MNPSWRLGRDIPVAHGPESRHYTPLATIVLSKHFNELPSACPEQGWVLGARTVSDRDVATELTGMYSQRVLAVGTHPGSPLPTDRLTGTAVGKACLPGVHFL